MYRETQPAQSAQFSDGKDHIVACLCRDHSLAKVPGQTPALRRLTFTYFITVPLATK